MEILLSFAQEQEDIILYHMLRNVEEPIFWIDVGANDPVEISVTKFFSCRNGHGINIEPQKDVIEKLKQDRPKDLNIAVGVSNKRGTLRLHGSGFGASFDSANPWVKDADSYDVPVMTLAEICEQYVSPPVTNAIHFLKIDVEGWEKECLEGMNFKDFRPWIVCMESTLPGTDIPCYDKWEYILLENGYIFAGASGINRYYAAQEATANLQAFCNAEELNKIYKILNYKTYSLKSNENEFEYLAQASILRFLFLKLKIRLSKYKTLKAIYHTLRKIFSKN